MVCEVHCIMGPEETMDHLEGDSVDLYSKVKLRRLSGKTHGGRHGNLGLYNVKLMTAGSGKSMGSVGVKSRRIGKNEGKTTVINSRKLEKNNGNFRGLTMTPLVEVNFCIDREGNRGGGVLSEIDCTLDEYTAVEVLGALKERRLETMQSEFKSGDLVWGKIKSHPWWPGQIFDEALVSFSSVKKTKGVGLLLVIFFGDDTYGWLDPKELIPFEPHYLELKNQSKNQLFLMAVQEVIDELNKRAALGFTCRCRNPSNFHPANASGLLKVDIRGYEEGATYSVDQVKRSREEFKPVEMLSFLKQLALRTTDMSRDGYFLKSVARLLAYREAVFEEKDDTYAEAFGMLPKNLTDFMEDASHPGKAILQGAASSNLSKSPGTPGLESKWKGTAKAISKNPEAPGLESYQKAILSGQSLTSEARDEGKILGKRVKLEKAIEGQKCSRTDTFCNASGDSVKGQLVEEETKEPGAVLVMTFPPRATMPSNPMLKANFERFGPLDISATYASWNSSTCQVGFKKMSDAQVAYDYVVQNENLFGNTKISYIYKAQKFLQPSRRLHNCVPHAVVRERVEVTGNENLFYPRKLILKVMQ